MAFPKTDSVNENALFYLLKTNGVLLFSQKSILAEKACLFPTSQKHYLSGHFWFFPFPCFHFSLFFRQHKRQNQKYISFRNPFWHPTSLWKLLWRPGFKKNKTGKHKQTILDQLLTFNWTNFWLMTPQSWTNFWLYNKIIFFTPKGLKRVRNCTPSWGAILALKEEGFWGFWCQFLVPISVLGVFGFFSIRHPFWGSCSVFWHIQKPLFLPKNM